MLVLEGFVLLTGDGSLRIDNQDFIVGKVVKMIDEVVDFTLFGGSVGERIEFVNRLQPF